MKKLISFYETKVKASSFFQLSILLFALLGAVTTISETYDVVSKLLEPAKEEKAISLLGVNKNYAAFSNEIGNSDYKEFLKFSKEEGTEQKVSVYHYSFENSYISLFTDENNIVIAYTVVAKKPNNRLPVPKIFDTYSNGNAYLNINTPLSKFNPTPYMVYAYNTSRDTLYNEIIGTGSYAGYNYYLLGFTQVGFIPDMDPILEFYFKDFKEDEDYDGNFFKYPNLKEYRKKIIPNSYGEIYRDASKDFLKILLERPIGPDKYDLPVEDKDK